MKLANGDELNVVLLLGCAAVLVVVIIASMVVSEQNAIFDLQLEIIRLEYELKTCKGS